MMRVRLQLKYTKTCRLQANRDSGPDPGGELLYFLASGKESGWLPLRKNHIHTDSLPRFGP